MSTNPIQHTRFTPTDDQPDGAFLALEEITASMLHLDDTILAFDRFIHVTCITWGVDNYVRIQGVDLSDGSDYDVAHPDWQMIERVLPAAEVSAMSAANDEANSFLPEEEHCAAAMDGCDRPAEWHLSSTDDPPRALCTLHMHATFAFWLTIPTVDDIRVERVR